MWALKTHGDLTDRYVTMDVAEAFLNDPYDFDGPHEPIVAATEADMDGALTMQIFKMFPARRCCLQMSATMTRKK